MPQPEPAPAKALATPQTVPPTTPSTAPPTAPSDTVQQVSEEAASPAPQIQGKPFIKALPYIAAAILLALTQGLGQGFVMTNVAQIAGDLGITQTQASWLVAAYMIPRASLTIMLIKIRTQYGLRHFAEIGIFGYVCVAFASLWIEDFRSALILQFLSGVAAAPLSSLAFLYMLEPMSQQWKMRFSLPMVLVCIMLGSPLARIISPILIGDGGLNGIHFTGLGLAMISLGFVYLLPLQTVQRLKVIRKLDLLSFSLIAFGFGGLTTCFIMGPIHWWRSESWIGWLLVSSILALTITVILELHRKEPLLDIRWISSPAMVHLAATLFIFRLILSEQTTGAPRMFTALGVAPTQMTVLFTIISLGTLLGGLACVAWMKANREVYFHFIALCLISLGTYMDSQATMQTRPEQIYLSQGLIAFASMLFMAPAMMKGLIAALSKGPNYILSFVIIFLSTQSIGGVIGSGFFTSLVNHRQAFHLGLLTEQLTQTAPQVQTTISQYAQSMAPFIQDLAQRKIVAISQIMSATSQQAYVMAYNDAYFLIFLIAVFACAMLLLHQFRDILAHRWAKTIPPTSAS